MGIEYKTAKGYTGILGVLSEDGLTVYQLTFKDGLLVEVNSI